MVNCSPSRQPEDKRLAPQLEYCVKCWRYQLHPIN
uniref:E2 early protein-like protein n=1 Tax=Myoviridae sp. ctzA421 TaxID=2826719 RepID=A0A8S5LUE5_9CAUD|nr:MAG TPA: E2 early protein-like protein [Myoviridae sp. ctzA421]